ncbi:MAG: MFS transporter, partial [Planctomycetota bacterium]
MLGLLKQRSFGFLVGSQLLGAFNDNAFKQLVLLLTVTATTADAVPWIRDSGLAVAADGSNQQWLPATLFGLPFVLLCSFTGSLADRFSKSRIIKIANALEIAVMACALGAFALESYAALLGVVFLMGAQSALFGPSKYGILPELVGTRNLSGANAIVQTSTTLAILGGVVLGGFLSGAFAHALWIPALVYVALASVGWLVSLPIEHQPAHAPDRPLRVNPFGAIPSQWRETVRVPRLLVCVLGSAFYYFVGALMLLLVNEYGIHVLELTKEQTSLLLAPVIVGIAAGAFLAGKLSGPRIEGGLVPLGLLGMVASLLAIHVAPLSTGWVGSCLGALGLFSGIFCLPIRTLVQVLPRDEARGSVIGLSQVFDFVGILSAGPAFKAMQSGGLGAGAMFTAVALLCLAAFLVSLRFAAHFTVRFVVWVLAHTLYRVKARGLEHLPARAPGGRGGALLVANHVSFVDAVLIAAVAGRDVRFLMFRGFFETPLLGWFARKMGAIPVSSSDSRAEKDQALAQAAALARDGALVCIFAEGAITRTGHVMPFASGMEKIARAAVVPVLPVALDRLWGSIFSFSGGRVFTKLPRQIPYKVDVAVGAPLGSD